MEPIRQTQKKYGSMAMTAAIFAALVFILAGQVAIGKGLVLGTVFSVLNFVLMGQALPTRLSLRRGRAVLLSAGSLLFRQAILAIPILLAVKFEPFDLASTVVGLFMVQILIMGEHLCAAILSNRKPI